MAVETTVTSAKAWAPDIASINPADAVPDALILQTSTVAGSIEGDAPVVRVQYVDDAAADIVAEGAPIPEADPTLAEAIVATSKVAMLVRLSREQWVQPGAEFTLSESVRRAVTKKGNEVYVAQAAPTAPTFTPPAGLLNVAGVQKGNAVKGNLDSLVDLVAQLEQNGATPSHVVLSPTAWALLRKMKTQTGSAQSLLGAGGNDSVKMLLDLPVIISAAVPDGQGLVIDKSAVVSAVGNVQVAQSADAYFGSDSIGLRCTWRFGATVVRPDRLGTFTVTA